jgi:hypothetical protein
LVIGIKADELEAAGAARTAPDRSGGWAGRLSTRLRALPSLGAVTASLIDEIDANRERWMLWSPVAFGLGAAGYLELKAEPSWALLVGLAAGLAILAGAGRAALGARRGRGCRSFWSWRPSWRPGPWRERSARTPSPRRSWRASGR